MRPLKPQGTGEGVSHDGTVRDCIAMPMISRKKAPRTTKLQRTAGALGFRLGEVERDRDFNKNQCDGVGQALGESAMHTCGMPVYSTALIGVVARPSPKEGR